MKAGARNNTPSFGYRGTKFRAEARRGVDPITIPTLSASIQKGELSRLRKLGNCDGRKQPRRGNNRRVSRNICGRNISPLPPNMPILAQDFRPTQNPPAPAVS